MLNLKALTRCYRFLAMLFLVAASAYASGAGYVGSAQCASCHQGEFSAWQGSQHQQAMMKADDDSVLATFDNVQRRLGKVTIQPFIKDGAYWLSETTEDGVNTTSKIDYTLGVYPLQQYMVRFDDGRMQLLPYAWDSRSEAEGGQRWYDLYPDFKAKDHAFNWRNNAQNWNLMCADCHSTHVKKNFDTASNTFNTTYSEMSVGCEACHGPGTEHLAAVKAGTVTSHSGLRNIGGQIDRLIEAGATPRPTSISHTDQVDTCAQCHSRRQQLNDDDGLLGSDYNSRYRLSLLTSAQYYPDGQIFDEDYVYGSFKQSKMYRQGITCSDCHNPHTAQLKLTLQQTCTQCHQASVFDTPKHTMHKPNIASVVGQGSACVDCHMPQTRYMGVDDRRDHSFNIPRPDLTIKTGSPNACTTCHDNQSDQWALNKIKQHFPHSTIIGSEHYGEAFSRADNGLNATQQLTKIAQDKNYPSIVRGSALLRLTDYRDPEVLATIKRGISSDKVLVRLGAVRGAAQMPLAIRWRLLNSLLDDNALSVRAEATGVLAANMANLTPLEQHALQKNIDEYIKIQLFNADRGGSHYNIGRLYLSLAEFKKAEDAFENAVRIEPSYAQAYLALADMQQRLKRESKVAAILNRGLKAAPNSGSLYHARGLAYVREKNTVAGLADLKKATELEPKAPRYHYVYGVAILQQQPRLAAEHLKTAWQLQPANLEVLYTLVNQYIRLGDKIQADEYLQRLQQRAPGAPWLKHIEQRINALR